VSLEQSVLEVGELVIEHERYPEAGAVAAFRPRFVHL